MAAFANAARGLLSRYGGIRLRWNPRGTVNRVRTDGLTEGSARTIPAVVYLTREQSRGPANRA